MRLRNPHDHNLPDDGLAVTNHPSTPESTKGERLGVEHSTAPPPINNIDPVATFVLAIIAAFRHRQTPGLPSEVDRLLARQVAQGLSLLVVAFPEAVRVAKVGGRHLVRDWVLVGFPGTPFEDVNVNIDALDASARRVVVGLLGEPELDPGYAPHGDERLMAAPPERF